MTLVLPQYPLAITEGQNNIFQAQGSPRADALTKMTGGYLSSDENILYDSTNEMRHFGEPSDEFGNEQNALQKGGRGRRNSTLSTVFTQQIRTLCSSYSKLKFWTKEKLKNIMSKT
ncbi:unnamed protein product [Euphydryas editha]|uniref:Uncharacterized protein n=1 Tax=Euphydryas editha TaxID=104508 RepID=A0AAU9UNT9_EUPED|nr:unnamed protein product [Euphydryas editha]